MAETVKKSRIVSDSDDNLEESLMEEFNLRLKNCMNNDETVEGETPESHVYENIETLRTNGIDKKVVIEQQNHHVKPDLTNGGSQHFIDIERDHISSNFKTANLINSTETETKNGYCHSIVDAYEDVSEAANIPNIKTDQVTSVDAKVEPVYDIPKTPAQEVEPKHFELSESMSNTEQDLTFKPNQIEIDSQQFEEDQIDNVTVQNDTKPTLNLPVTCLVDLSEIKPESLEIKSAKDRMLLSTDNTSCLLFTQTVTSPMLTPSEENIDFLKALQNQSTFSETSNTTSDAPSHEQGKHVPIFDPNLTISEPDSEALGLGSEGNSKLDGELDEDNLSPTKTEPEDVELSTADDVQVVQNGLASPDKNEIIYENAEFLREHADNMENIYENVDVIREVSKISSSSECKAAMSEISGDTGMENNVLNLDENCGNNNFKAETCEFIRNEIRCLEDDENLVIQTDVQSKVITSEPEETTLEEHSGDCNENIPENQEVLLSEATPEIQSDELQPKQHTPEASGDDKATIEVNSVEKQSEKLIEEIESNEEKIETRETVSEVKESAESIENKEYTTMETTESINKFESEKVKSLKLHFMKTESSTEVVTTQKMEEKELEELKSFNIMKKISKFESNSVVAKDSGTTNACSNQNNSSTIVTTETHFVETTTDLTNGEDKALKKKKSKKSKKEHEKENISVTETKEEESFYNVNVKNLCRSFGDLTKIEKDKDKNKLERNWRTKSLNDVRPLGFEGVSVRALRDKFNVDNENKDLVNFFAMATSNNINDRIQKLKSSFNKFDALQKKNVLHVRSSDASKAQEKFSGSYVENSNCKACDKPVFQMELIKAEKAVWHKNCFRCLECKKQLTVDTFQSHEGNVYCKPHFKALFAPKVVDDDAPLMPRKYELIIRENQPQELPPDVVRASDKPDLGLEELQSLNVRERFQVFEHHQSETNQVDKSPSPVNVKRSPSILSKLARFQAKGMNVGVTDESLNGIPIELSESEEEEEDNAEGEDADLIRAKRVQKEKPFHFVQLSDVKNKWEHVNENTKDERREERKQEIQTIRSRLFLGKQGKMKEAYQQAVMEAESGHAKKTEPIEITKELTDTRTIKEKFEKGELTKEEIRNKEAEDMSIFESGISKKSRSIFQELDANSSKPPQLSPVSTPKLGISVRSAREAYLNRQASEDVVRSSDTVDDIVVQTAAIQDRFKFFETYKEPEKMRKEFRITPPREGQVKGDSPDKEVYRDPELVRAEDQVEDSVVAKQTHTATKMLNKFRQMEENLLKEQEPQGPKPLKRFTPPREPIRRETSTEEEESGSEEESEEENERPAVPDADLLEAQKAARAKQLRAKFERWEAEEIKRETNTAVNITEEIGDEQSQIESTRSLRARFESMRDSSSTPKQAPKVKVNRFVEKKDSIEICSGCGRRVYPLEKITLHGLLYHKNCFRCMECNAILRMDSYCYNKGLLYCMTHFKRLFISKGDYDTGFGLGSKEKWNVVAS